MGFRLFAWFAGTCLALAGVCVGCGGRTVTESGAGGAGGAPSTGSSGGIGGTGGSGGNGEAGGVPVACSALTLDGIRLLENPGGYDQTSPVLVEAESGDEPIAMLVYAQTFIPGPAVPTPDVTSVYFEAWTNWPATEIDSDGGELPMRSFSVSSAENEFGGHSLLLDSFDDDLVFMPTWGLGAWPWYSVDSGDLETRFVARGTFDHFIGYQRRVGGDHQLVAGTFNDGVFLEEQPACASSDLVATAEYVGSHYVLATGSSDTWGQCAGVTLSPPTHLHIAVAANGLPLMHVADFFNPLAISGNPNVQQVEVVSFGAEAWVVWKYEGYAPLVGVRINANTGVHTEPTQLVVLESSTDEFVATALGDKLVIGRSMQNINPISFHLSVFDVDGAELFDALVIDDLTAAEPSYSLLASPANDALLAAWRGADGTLRVARLSCE
jgi:hypothetical protein